MKTQNLIVLAALIGGGYLLYKKVIRPKLAQKEIERQTKERETVTDLIAQTEVTPGATVDEFAQFEIL